MKTLTIESGNRFAVPIPSGPGQEERIRVARGYLDLYGVSDFAFAAESIDGTGHLVLRAAAPHLDGDSFEELVFDIEREMLPDPAPRETRPS